MNTHFDEKQLGLIRRNICTGASEDEFQMFLAQCQRTGLDPFARQIYWSKKSRSAEVNIDGFRLVAEKTGEYRGQCAPLWCGQDGQWKDVWLSSDAPAAAKIGVHRERFAEPMIAIARFDGYAQRNSRGEPAGLWAKMPDLMIAKCAEALALRKAFPQELSGIYTTDEMQQAYAPSAPEEQRPVEGTPVVEVAPPASVVEPVVEPESARPESWRDVVIHVGKEGGKMRGAKLGAADATIRKCLVEKWLPKAGNSADDKLLRDGITAMLAEEKEGDELPMEFAKEVVPTSAPIEEEKEESPAPKVETPAPETEKEPAPSPKETLALESEPTPEKIDWKSVRVHFGKPQILSKRLGELEKDWLKAVFIFAVPLLGTTLTPYIEWRRGKTAAAAKEIDDKFRTAVLAGAQEMELITPAVEAHQVLMIKIARLGMVASDVDAALRKAKIFTAQESVMSATEEMVGVLLSGWENTEKVLTSKGE